MGVPRVKHRSEEDAQMNEIAISEQKRLESLKRRKEAYKAKEQAVQNALKNLDSAPKKKIIFDDNIEDIAAPKAKRKKKKDLFDDDAEDKEEAIEPNWEKNDAQIKTSGKTPFTKYAFGNDERFKMDERFAEEDNEPQSNETKVEDESDLQKEKERQLDLLENILGIPMTPKNKETNIPKKSMIRYDPTEQTHHSYEIVQDHSEPNVKKSKKQRKREQEANEQDKPESEPVAVSKEIFYKVSEDLTKSFKDEGQGFSLLQKFGREDTSKTCKEDNQDLGSTHSDKKGKLKFGFDTANPFKYDSSDQENDDDELGPAIVNNTDTIKEQNSFSTPDRFFFQLNDARFDEAVNFFSKTSVPPEEFKDLRRELKQIMRSKIRQNVQKSGAWSGKKKVVKPRSKKAS